MSDAEEVKKGRAEYRDAVVHFAEIYVQHNGVEGLYDSLFRCFGSRIGSSAKSIREWMREIPGWLQVKEAALKVYTDQKNGLDPNHPDLRRLERRVQQVENENAQLNEKLKHHNEKETVFESLKYVVEDNIAPLEVVEPKVDFSSVDEEQHPVDMVAADTDQHADEVVTSEATWGTERYNFDIFCLRRERWAKLITEYATVHLPKHRVERLWTFLLGDALHGDGHGNKNRNHFGNTMRGAVAVADVIAESYAYILQYIPYMSVVAVSGNHPRTTAKKDHVDPHDNFDFMVAALVAARMRGYTDAGRFDLHAPKSWSAFVDVRGKVMALNHGDDVTGTWGIPWYGFAKKEARVQSQVGRKQSRIDFFWYGHHHTDMAVTENGSRSIHSGAYTATDAWTLEKLGAGGEPMQAMMIIDDRPGMRSRLMDVPIWLRDPEVEAKYWRGKLTPAFGRANTLIQIAGKGDGTFPLIKARK